MYYQQNALQGSKVKALIKQQNGPTQHYIITYNSIILLPINYCVSSIFML